MHKEYPKELRKHPPLIVNGGELAFIARISPHSVRNYSKAGILPRTKIGKRVSYRLSQIETALAKLERRVP